MKYYKLGNDMMVAEELDTSLPQFTGAIELTKEQYDAECTPEKSWQRYMLTLASLTSEQKREVLYKTLRYRLVGDIATGALDYSRPFYETLTVDEMSDRFIKYLGDNDEIANASLAGKVEAKNYIRSLF